jgi:Carboxypeptidase regulatory-like domain
MTSDYRKLGSQGWEYIRGRAGAVALAMLLAGTLLGQTNQGSITGTVTDASGAVVPNAKIGARETATGTVYNTVSGSSGGYTFSNVRLGTYEVTTEFAGFKKWQSTGVVVQINATTSLDIVLQPGQNTETVTVEGSAPTVQTDTSDVGTGVTSKQILDLPLALGSAVQAMRSPEAFVFLTPGAIGPGTAGSGQNGTNGGTFESKINGGQAYATEILLDGASTTRSENGSSFDETAPSVDAISEFRIITSTPSAQYGRTTGGITSFALRSGTNAYHGSAYDIFRNEDLDANSFFNNSRGFTRPLDRQNDYGMTFGGPVWLPKLYHGKNKTFFFFSWEQYRQSQGGVTTSTVPTAANKTGDFSQQLTNISLGTNPCDGSTIFQGEIFDPRTTQTVNGVQCRTAFQGNKIPSNLISPFAPKVFQYYPDPTNGNAINNYTLPWSLPVLDTDMSLRGDQNLSDKQKLFFSYVSRDNVRTSVNPYFANEVGSGRAQDFFTHYIRGGHDYIFTPTLLNHLLLSIDRTNSSNKVKNAFLGKDWNSLLGIKGASGPMFPVIGLVEGSTTWLGDDVFGDTIDNHYGLSDSMDWIKGKHNFKFGYEQRFTKYAPTDASRSTGDYYFWRQQTAGTPLTSGQSGNGIASFELGLVHDSNLIQKAGQPTWISNYIAGFFQDTYKVTKTLTLNLGLRWDVDVPRREKYGNTSNISLTTPNPGANGHLGALVFAGTGAGRNGNTGETWAKTYWKDWGPRFGFAWAPERLGGKTVVRGGFSIYYGALQYADFGGFGRQGFQANPSFTSPDGFSPAFNLSSGFPGYTPPPNLDPNQYNNAGPQYLDPSYGRPAMVNNWSIEIQHQLVKDLILDVAYVGSHGTHLHTNYDAVNSLTPNNIALGGLLSQQLSSPQAKAAGISAPYASFSTNQTVAQALVPFPQYFGFNTDGQLENLGQSTFNALEVSLQRRFSSGLNLMASYTWSKTLTDADDALPFFATLHGGGSVQNPFNLKGEKSYSNQDVPQMFVISYVYELPIGKGKKFLNKGGVVDAVLGGWEISGIQRYQSGQPVSFRCATGIPGFAGCIRFNQVGGVSIFSDAYKSGNFDPSSGVAIFNKAAFSDPNAPARIAAGGGYAFGNMSRTLGSVRMQHFDNEDFNILKRFPITERVKLEFKASAINAFNRHVFDRPGDTNANDPQFGVLNTNATLETPRRLQLQLKIMF